MEVINRFVRSATAEFDANEDGTVSEAYFEMYRQLALGKIGAIIQGHLYISEEGKAHKGMAGIASEQHLPLLKKITQTVHETGTGSKIIAQLNHGGAHSVSKKAPSTREDFEKEDILVMTDQDIQEVIKAFGLAATRAKEVGYDAVQIHAAHGYLISQFLSSRTNKREDDWGGSLEKRAKILLKVYDEIRSIVGDDYPILVKINGSDDPHEGFNLEEASQVIGGLSSRGINAVEISGMNSSKTFRAREEGYFYENALQIKKDNPETTLILVGGVRTLDKMNQIIASGIDFVSICRPFIREPGLVIQFEKGKEKGDCISCNKCRESPQIVKCMVLLDES